MRDYQKDHDDLSVKVPNGNISVRRSYYRGNWYFDLEKHHLRFPVSPGSIVFYSIKKGDYVYNPIPGHNRYVYKTYTITQNETGFLWQDKHGAYKTYDTKGLMTSYGDRRGVTATFVYNTSDKLTGILDSHNNQVIWFEYHEEAGGNVSAVRDAANRRVEYTYTNGNLTNIKDISGNITTYAYETVSTGIAVSVSSTSSTSSGGSGSVSAPVIRPGIMIKKTNRPIIKSIDSNGNITNITYDKYKNVASVTDSKGNGHFFEFDYNQSTKESYVKLETSSGRVKEVWYDRDFETKQVRVNGIIIKKITKDGRNLIITDAKGNITKKEYDGGMEWGMECMEWGQVYC